MKCKKCGNEIQEGNSFCVNCGTSIETTKKISNINTKNEKNINDKTKMKNRLKVLITIIIISIIIICISIVVFFKSKDKEVINNNNEVTENIEQEKMYITQNSDVSPTKKEFIGVFSDKLTEIMDKKTNEYFKSHTYNTSIENMFQYSSEVKITNNITQKRDKVNERTYFYNSVNNHFIGSREMIYDLNNTIKGLEMNNTNINEYVTNFLKGALAVFMNYHNMDEEQKNSQEQKDKFNEWQNSLTQYSTEEATNLEFDNYKCSYNILGADCLYVCTKFNDDNNKMEFLMLAYDENVGPEETIKNWYNTVYTKEEISKTKEDLLEEIYAKYPELENSDVQICTDDNETYWLLDKDGKKVYFSDLETFESALEKCNITSEEIKNTESSINNKQNDSSNNYTSSSNNSNVSNESSNSSNNMTSNWKNWTTYIGVPREFKISYNNKYCVLKQWSGYYICCLNNPTSTNNLTSIMGAKYYINGTELTNKKSLSGSNELEGFKYTFNNTNNITFKIVVPYLYDADNNTVVGQDVTIFEKTYSVESLYKNNTHGYDTNGFVELPDIPTIW